MTKKEEPSDDPGYWEIRDMFQRAALSNDVDQLEMLVASYPDIFNNIMGQVKNSKTRYH